MSDQTTTRVGMLAAKGSSSAPVPLIGVSIDAEIRSVYARVVVAQRYVNRESNPIEAVYVFPLDEGAAVCGFEAIVDGTLVIGEVHEREKAFEIYDDAMEQGHGAFLLDEERPDVFQASIGNLPPGKEVLVKLTYVTELTVNDRRLRFSIPTTVSPRYAPAEDHSGMGRPDAETLNPPVEWTVPYGLNLSVQVSMPGRISGIESPSHPIAMTLDDCRAMVTLAQQDAALDRDFVLSVEAIGLDAPFRRGGARRGGRRSRRRDVQPGIRGELDTRRADLRRRSVRLDGGQLNRGSPQRAAALLAVHDFRLLLQHRRVREHPQGLICEEPRLQPEES